MSKNFDSQNILLTKPLTYIKNILWIYYESYGGTNYDK